MTNIVIDSDGDNVIIATNKNPVVICAGIQGVAGINGNGTGASGITGFTNGSGFVGNVSAGNLSLTLQDANTTQSGQLTASSFNAFTAKGTSNLTIGSTNITAFQGDLGAALSGDFTNHTGNVSNPHNVTKSQIGLSNVTDVTPLELPISNATQTALNAKQDPLISGTNIKTINGVTILGSGDMTITGGNVSGIASFTDGGGFTGTVTNNSLSLTLQNANATQSGQVTAGKYTDWDAKGTSNLTLGSTGTTALKGNATTADITASTDKNYVTDAELTVLTQTSGSNTGDNATNTLYSGLVSNANHTGDATGSTALTLATVNNNAGVFGNATTVPIITVNGKGLVTNITNVTISGGSGTVTNVTATAPVVSSGGTAPNISMAAATSSVDGYMTSTYAGKLDSIAANSNVTYVQGNGTVNGLTLTGNVTGGGNLTLGGTLSGTAASLTAGNVTNIPALSGVITGNSTGTTTLTANGTTSVQLAAALTDETGTGSAVFGTNCTLNTPNLTTPSFANLSSAIGLNLTSGVSSILPKANGGTAVPDCQVIGQVVNTQVTAVATGTTIMPFDDTIPQNTEGNEFMSLAITPKSAASTLIIDVQMQLSSSVIAAVSYGLFQDSTVSAICSGYHSQLTAGVAIRAVIRYTMTSGTTSSTTFKVRAGGSAAGTMTINGIGGARYLGGSAASSITITEYLP